MHSQLLGHYYLRISIVYEVRQTDVYRVKIKIATENAF